MLCAMLLCGGMAQAQSLPPKWLNNGLEDLRFSYVEVVSADAKTVNDARDKAAQAIVQRRNLAVGAEVTVRVIDGQITTTGSQDMIVNARILDEYVMELDYEGWRVYLLVQTLKHPQYSFENVAVTDDYPFSTRAFVPGMEQLYKGQRTKGILFIAGEVVGIGGIVTAESLRTNYVNLITSTHNAKQRASYTNSANNWGNIRNGFIAATAVVYVWNVVDALTSKGARYLNTLAFAPYAAPDTFGLTLNLSF